MRKLWLVVSLIALLIASVVMVSCAAPTPATSPAPAPAVTPSPAPAPAPAPTPAKVYTFKFSTTAPPALWEAAIVPFLDAIEKESRGTIKFERYPFGQLLDDKSTMDGIARGIAESGQIVDAYNPGALPMTEIENLPFTWSSGIDGSKMGAKFLQYEPIKAEWEKAGLKPILTGRSTPSYLASTKQVKTFEDMKGLKIRSFGTIVPKMLEFLGAIPTSLPAVEAYEAMQRGLLDANPGTLSNLWDWKSAEVAKYITIFPTRGGISYGCVTAVWSLQVWNTLPKDIQDIILRVAQSKSWYGEAYSNMDATAKTKLEAAGAVFYELLAIEEAKFVAQSDKVGEWWVEQRKDKGPSQDVYDHFISLLKEAGLR